jgi:DNA-binding LacI/PurR family transcriptional regulator
MAGVSVPTLQRCESDHPAALGVAGETQKKIQAALESAGIEFLNHDQPGLRLKKRPRRR